MQPCKLCPRCQKPHALDATQCNQCGHLFRTQFQNMDLDRTQVVTPPVYLPPTSPYLPYPQQPVPPYPVYYPQAEVAPRTSYIVVMWVLTGLSVLFASVSTTAAFLTDFPAFILAIILVCSRSRVDRINGWIKLAIELLGFLIVVSGTPASGPVEAPSRMPMRQNFAPQDHSRQTAYGLPELTPIRARLMKESRREPRALPRGGGSAKRHQGRSKAVPG